MEGETNNFSQIFKMNNEKLILRALEFLLFKSQTLSEKEVEEKTEILEKIRKELNPKEVLPYAESLAVNSSSEESNERK